MNESQLLTRLGKWQTMSPEQTSELIHLLHLHSTPATLAQVAKESALYDAPGPEFATGETYSLQAEVALIGLKDRPEPLLDSSVAAAAFRQIFRALAASKYISGAIAFAYLDAYTLKDYIETQLPQDRTTQIEFASLARQVACNLASQQNYDAHTIKSARDALNKWAASLERKAANKVKSKKATKAKSRVTTKQPSKKTPRGRKSS
jgi:hypothetical protein